MLLSKIMPLTLMFAFVLGTPASFACTFSSISYHGAKIFPLTRGEDEYNLNRNGEQFFEEARVTLAPKGYGFSSDSDTQILIDDVGPILGSEIVIDSRKDYEKYKTIPYEIKIVKNGTVVESKTVKVDSDCEKIQVSGGHGSHENEWICVPAHLHNVLIATFHSLNECK